jgi:hypothetical protein
MEASRKGVEVAMLQDELARLRRENELLQLSLHLEREKQASERLLRDVSSAASPRGGAPRTDTPAIEPRTSAEAATQSALPQKGGESEKAAAAPAVGLQLVVIERAERPPDARGETHVAAGEARRTSVASVVRSRRPSANTVARRGSTVGSEMLLSARRNSEAANLATFFQINDMEQKNHSLYMALRAMERQAQQYSGAEKELEVIMREQKDLEVFVNRLKGFLSKNRELVNTVTLQALRRENDYLRQRVTELEGEVAAAASRRPILEPAAAGAPSPALSSNADPEHLRASRLTRKTSSRAGGGARESLEMSALPPLVSSSVLSDRRQRRLSLRRSRRTTSQKPDAVPEESEHNASEHAPDLSRRQSSRASARLSRRQGPATELEAESGGEGGSPSMAPLSEVSETTGSGTAGASRGDVASGGAADGESDAMLELMELELRLDELESVIQEEGNLYTEPSKAASGALLLQLDRKYYENRLREVQLLHQLLDSRSAEGQADGLPEHLANELIAHLKSRNLTLAKRVVLAQAEVLQRVDHVDARAQVLELFSTQADLANALNHLNYLNSMRTEQLREAFSWLREGLRRQSEEHAGALGDVDEWLVRDRKVADMWRVAHERIGKRTLRQRIDALVENPMRQYCGWFAELFVTSPALFAGNARPQEWIEALAASAYLLKIKENRAADRDLTLRPSLAEVILNRLMSIHRIRQLAECHAMEVIFNVHAHASSPRIRLFARFIGLLDPLQDHHVDFFLLLVQTLRDLLPPSLSKRVLRTSSLAVSYALAATVVEKALNSIGEQQRTAFFLEALKSFALAEARERKEPEQEGKDTNGAASTASQEDDEDAAQAAQAKRLAALHLEADRFLGFAVGRYEELLRSYSVQLQHALPPLFVKRQTQLGGAVISVAQRPEELALVRDPLRFLNPDFTLHAFRVKARMIKQRPKPARSAIAAVFNRLTSAESVLCGEPWHAVVGPLFRFNCRRAHVASSKELAASELGGGDFFEPDVDCVVWQSEVGLSDSDSFEGMTPPRSPRTSLEFALEATREDERLAELEASAARAARVGSIASSAAAAPIAAAAVAAAATAGTTSRPHESRDEKNLEQRQDRAALRQLAAKHVMIQVQQADADHGEIADDEGDAPLVAPSESMASLAGDEVAT